MARPTPKPCTVPGCKGRLERGKHQDGAEHEWCVVCERRILQLRALQERPPAPPVTKSTDAQLLRFVQSRTWNLSQVETATKRSANLIRAAIKSGALPCARVGRYMIVSREAAKTWAEHYQRKVAPDARALAIIASLPREASKALTVEEWSKVVKRAPGTLHAWAKKRRAKDPRLKVCAALSSKSLPVYAYWWKEDARA